MAPFCWQTRMAWSEKADSFLFFLCKIQRRSRLKFPNVYSGWLPNTFSLYSLLDIVLIKIPAVLFYGWGVILYLSFWNVSVLCDSYEAQINIEHGKRFRISRFQQQSLWKFIFYQSYKRHFRLSAGRNISFIKARSSKAVSDLKWKLFKHVNQKVIYLAGKKKKKIPANTKGVHFLPYSHLNVPGLLPYFHLLPPPPPMTGWWLITWSCVPFLPLKQDMLRQDFF